MVKTLKKIKLLDAVLISQMVAAFGVLYFGQGFIFLIFSTFALLSRVVFGFFEVNLHESHFIPVDFRKAVRIIPAVIVVCLFFSWVLKTLIPRVISGDNQTISGADEFFFRSPYLVVSLVFLIGVSVIASGAILRGYKRK